MFKLEICDKCGKIDTYKQYRYWNFCDKCYREVKECNKEEK